MTSTDVDLRRQIETFDIDGDSVGLPFAARLARENGWSRAYADRVIAEYKRFVFLSMISETPVCPSEDVDAAWHLHLTYTRSYWKRFCGDVLGRQLHHEPTKGGPAEHEKHLAMYSRTLALYRVSFSEEPPADIWPAAEIRFGEDLAHRAVNTKRNWVIPKTPVLHVAKLAVAFAVVAMFIPGCNGGWNPFALVGADFLSFLVPALIGAVILGRMIRSRQRGPTPTEADEEPKLTWQEMAYLAGGSARLTTAVVARLVGCGAARVDGDRLVRGEHEVPDGASAVEQTVLSALPVSKTLASFVPIAKAVEATFADNARKLEADGLLMSQGQRAGAGCLAIVPLLLVLLGFALPRLVMGLANNKPVDYLVFTSIFGLVVGAIICFAGTSRLTRRGEHALRKLKFNHFELSNGVAWDGTRDAALAVALFGTAALVGSSIAYLQDWYPRQMSAMTATGGCGAAGCATGGCGGGAGGCGGGGGGCGGGGCGGCGGGGGGD